MNARRFFADRMSVGLMVLAAVVVLAAPAAWADPPIRAARLNYVTGPVSLAPAGLPDEWGEAFVNRPLTVGDRLWADSGARAELRLGSTALRIDGGTSLDILDIDGVRATTADGWWLLRASNTQPALVARAEASNAEGLARLKAALRRNLEASGVALPDF